MKLLHSLFILIPFSMLFSNPASLPAQENVQNGGTVEANFPGGDLQVMGAAPPDAQGAPTLSISGDAPEIAIDQAGSGLGTYLGEATVVWQPVTDTGQALAPTTSSRYQVAVQLAAPWVVAGQTEPNPFHLTVQPQDVSSTQGGEIFIESAGVLAQPLPTLSSQPSPPQGVIPLWGLQLASASFQGILLAASNANRIVIPTAALIQTPVPLPSEPSCVAMLHPDETQLQGRVQGTQLELRIAGRAGGISGGEMVDSCLTTVGFDVAITATLQ